MSGHLSLGLLTWSHNRFHSLRVPNRLAIVANMLCKSGQGSNVHSFPDMEGGAAKLQGNDDVRGALAVAELAYKLECLFRYTLVSHPTSLDHVYLTLRSSADDDLVTATSYSCRFSYPNLSVATTGLAPAPSFPTTITILVHRSSAPDATITPQSRPTKHSRIF